MRAYILISTDVGKVDEVREQLRAVRLDGLHILYVDLVAGIYDVIVVVEANEPQRVGRLVVDTIRHIEGVTGTITLLQLA